MTERIIGIMGAMPEEIDGVVQLLSERQEFSMGMRTYYTGKINDIRTVVVFSRWGKVAAATSVSNLILEFKISELIFTGVAGSTNSKVRIGDIVLAKRLVQHDMDARPIMKQFEIPLLERTYLECQAKQIDIASNSINQLIENKHLHSIFEADQLREFGIEAPKLFVGDIASGDKFFSSNEDKVKLLSNLPTILCVEMEGASVAQVCYEYGIPFTILRTISDSADENAHVDFPSFIKKISSKYSVQIIKNIYNQFSN